MDSSASKVPTRVFVSYARQDKKWLDPDYQYNLIPFLKHSLRKQNVVFWYDKGLIPGDEFKPIIRAEIDRAQIALLIVSQHFLNSEFIESEEMPRIADRAKQGQMVVVPILVEPSDWNEYDLLANRHMFPASRPLIEFTDSEIRWTNVRQEIFDAIKEHVKRIQTAREPPRPLENQEVTADEKPVREVDSEMGIGRQAPTPSADLAVGAIEHGRAWAETAGSPARAAPKPNIWRLTSLELKGGSEDEDPNRVVVPGTSKLLGFIKRPDTSPIFLRIFALECYREGDYLHAERVLRRLLDGNFEVASTRCLLARVLLATDRDNDARSEVDKAWESQTDWQPYTAQRIYLLQALFGLLQDGIAPREALQNLKRELLRPDAMPRWDLRSLLDHLKPRLTPEAHELFEALSTAINDRAAMKYLDTLPAWKAIL